MKLIEKILIVALILAIMNLILTLANIRDDKMSQAYENCTRMVDIDGNYQLICE